jgi:non-specific serine/threonine protein kinase
MIVAPVSVIMTWVKELKKWTPNCKNVVNYHNVNTSDRRRTLRSVNDGVKRNGSAVIITSYGTIQAQADLIQKEFKDTTFDLIILDEGHKIKNTKAKTTNSLRSAIKARSKFALTGTPIMNRINEMWGKTIVCMY